MKPDVGIAQSGNSALHWHNLPILYTKMPLSKLLNTSLATACVHGGLSVHANYLFGHGLCRLCDTIPLKKMFGRSYPVLVAVYSRIRGLKSRMHMSVDIPGQSEKPKDLLGPPGVQEMHLQSIVISQFAGETLLLLHPTIVLGGGYQSPSPAGTSESNLNYISSGTKNEGVLFSYAIVTDVLQVALLKIVKMYSF
ncbi:uncharacterized protein ARB_05059 [Trichophyton benhamiae CBS 112371]|uniref:Uncharacterized protein n=1 Tax=Arthroderma benhamiae (strain ATCC MYA-4681 / CBS 112371) TaxID=663331 RepID=D4AL62_ARTBC|nr:uncharacterized protein ARB_05059 [Trichophyton benhamiae CBS 112371]EFE36121.1 hypothetical protein ARB_05059 [Trichophyton benhamiae CBS 112371]